MIYDYENKELIIKIVYYGPAMSGKTTSIMALFSHFGKKTSVKSIESTVGRTLFFDFGVLRFNGHNWSLKFLIYSATGQDFYASTRPATLNGVDGVIFICDGQLNSYDRNLRSWGELLTLYREEIYTIPIVVSLNKCDIGGNELIDELDFLRCISSEKYVNLAINRTSALNGVGIVKAFSEMIKFLFPELKLNVPL